MVCDAPPRPNPGTNNAITNAVTRSTPYFTFIDLPLSFSAAMRAFVREECTPSSPGHPLDSGDRADYVGRDIYACDPVKIVEGGAPGCGGTRSACFRRCSRSPRWSSAADEPGRGARLML